MWKNRHATFKPGIAVASGITGMALAISFVVPTQAAFAQGQASVSPNDLYKKAWKVIKDSYFDQRFLGQNWQRWEHKYDGLLKNQVDAEKAIETMLASLGNPYTRFLSAEVFLKKNEENRGSFVGVGMQLGMNKEHNVIVVAPMSGSPAAKVGIQRGDQIVAINHNEIKGQSLDQVIKQIKGNSDTQVSITYMRGDKQFNAILTRQEIPVRSVSSRFMLPGEIGYIRFDSFVPDTAAKEMAAAISTLAAKDDHAPAKALIIDLRSAQEGKLHNVIDIANMFLKSGVIVSTIDADGYKTSQLATGSVPFKTDLPVVLLINMSSAFTSEMLAAALRDNKRAEIVGNTSFGKGLIEASCKLGNGSAVDVSIAYCLTPKDIHIHRSGITPDYVVKLTDEDYKSGRGPWWYDARLDHLEKHSPSDGKDIQLAKAIEVISKQIAGPRPADKH